MNEQVLEQVAKMLRAQLKGAGHLWWVGGFVYGITGNNDPFIILYPADEKLHEKVVRVYPHDFKKLPAFIPTDVDSGDTEANPNKEQARKKGIYHECPIFEIVTFDGKETQMGRERRFGDVLRLSRKAAEAVTEAQRQQKPVQQQPLAPQPQQRPAQQQRPPELPAESATLPDYRRLAVETTAAHEFDYAAYMVLRNGVYDSVERITKTRISLVPEWQPSPATNEAALLALEVYRDKRAAAEAGGDELKVAHQTAKKEAVKAYKTLLEE